MARHFAKNDRADTAPCRRSGEHDLAQAGSKSALHKGPGDEHCRSPTMPRANEDEMAVRRRARAALILAILVVIIGAGAGYLLSGRRQGLAVAVDADAYDPAIGKHRSPSERPRLRYGPVAHRRAAVRRRAMGARRDADRTARRFRLSPAVAISEAALEVQRRQLAATEQNLVSAQKTVESDVADSP